MKLDPSRVPEPFRNLLPLAEEWGIGDDYQREEKVEKATPAQLADLVSQSKTFGDLYEWLAGPESYESEPSEEYVALTCLTMAWDSARVRIESAE